MPRLYPDSVTGMCFVNNHCCRNFHSFKVTYQTDSFWDKNRYYVVMGHCNLLSSSKCYFVAGLFSSSPEESSRSSYKFSSVSSRFKTCWRMYKVRLAFQNKQRSIVAIQCLLRQKLAKRELRRLKKQMKLVLYAWQRINLRYSWRILHGGCS